MTPERWQEIESVLQAALDRPATQREVLLDELCPSDEALKTEAAALISAHDQAGDFLERPALAQDVHLFVDDLHNVGRLLGPYRVIERLGSGGMSEVYLAQDERLNRLVALKVLPAYFVSDESRLRRFRTEARAASALNHPNILTIYEVGELENSHFIAAEFIDGQTIRELILTEVLVVGEVFGIVSQIMSGLCAAHSAGIIHRDIKPENVMRRNDGIVKVLDFGIAKLTEPTPFDHSTTVPCNGALTEIGLVLGTVGYMSPEQARGLRVDERTDTWSSGVLLYELLTGRLPFTRQTRMDTMVAILERDPQPIFEKSQNTSSIFGQIEHIVSKALRKEVNERYQTATEMLVDLRAISEQLKLANESGEQFKLDSRTPVKEIPRIISGSKMTTPADFVAKADARAVRQARNRVLMLSAAILLLALIAGVLFNQWSQLRTDTKGTPASKSIAKLYTQMNQSEQLAFVNQHEQQIAEMMGDRPVKLNEEALFAIKKRIDRYVAHQDVNSTKSGGENLRTLYGRAGPYIPTIARSFAARRIPIVVGIYLPMIESAYEPCYENSYGAKGLFQFLPQTARQYGVDQSEMCDTEKMAPAAAHYIADRMAELGDDSQSMTLVLLSYNRGADSVREALRRLRDSGNYERNFWTLFGNRDKLNDVFGNESEYIPTFFAAAIIGENPQAFDLQIQPLSTLAEPTDRAK